MAIEIKGEPMTPELDASRQARAVGPVKAANARRARLAEAMLKRSLEALDAAGNQDAKDELADRATREALGAPNRP